MLVVVDLYCYVIVDWLVEGIVDWVVCVFELVFDLLVVLGLLCVFDWWVDLVWVGYCLFDGDWCWCGVGGIVKGGE